MARRGCEFDDTLYFTEGVAQTVTRTYQGGAGETYALTITYDGAHGIEVHKSEYGSVTARVTYEADDAQVPYITFGTRKAGVTPGLFSASFGEGLVAQYARQLVAGMFNAAVDKLFALGNGTDDSNRSNALTVDWSGNVECGTVNGVDMGDVEYCRTDASTSSNVNVANNTNKSLCSVTITEPGVYLLIGHCFFASSASGRRAVGYTSTADASTGATATNATVTVPAASGGATALSIMDVVEVAHGGSPITRYLTLWQNSGSTLTAQGSIKAVRISPPSTT